jgi:hypothetical protein
MSKSDNSEHVIEEKDLKKYLESNSDFHFEIEALNRLSRLGYECKHGGMYVDPVTTKRRQFDLRGVRRYGRRVVRLAVECKNLRPTFPLLVHRIPRRAEESFHEIAIAVDRDQTSLVKRDTVTPPACEPQAKNVRLEGHKSIYRPAEPVGKSTVQVGYIPQKDGRFKTNDEEIYKGVEQATSSAQDLIDHATYEAGETAESALLSVVIPVVVVPDSTLWVVDYDSDGEIVGRPRRVRRCSYYVGASYYGGDNLSGSSYHVSHLEFVTLSGLAELVDDLGGNTAKLGVLFPDDLLLNLRKSLHG